MSIPYKQNHKVSNYNQSITFHTPVLDLTTTQWDLYNTQAQKNTNYKTRFMISM